MIEEYKNLIASYDGAQMEHQESKVKVIGAGVSITVIKFKLSVPHKRHFIIIDNEYGTNNSATVKMKVDKGFIPEFKITARNHLKNLFARKKRYFEVESSNVQFKSYLEEVLLESGMDEIAKENLFEPTIQVERIDGSQYINTEYHLQIKDKIGAIKALIDFYKLIIDRF